MAKVEKNVVLQGLSGSLGNQITLKRDKAGRTIVSLKPVLNGKREFSAEQKAHRAEFKEATLYARTAAKMEAIYAEKAQGKPQSAYNVAVADWFHAPEIEAVDLSGWSGQAGETIRVRAMDNVMVKQVSVVITDEQAVVVERGLAVPNGEPWWVYTTTASVTGRATVAVEATDLPRHVARTTRQREN